MNKLFNKQHIHSPNVELEEERLFLLRQLGQTTIKKSEVFCEKHLPLVPLSPLQERLQLACVHGIKEYYVDLFIERWGILQFDGGYDENVAERAAKAAAFELYLVNDHELSDKLDTIDEHLEKHKVRIYRQLAEWGIYYE